MLPTSRGAYTKEIKYKAAELFVILGRATDVAAQLDIPQQTVYSWIKQDWWETATAKAKRENAELIEAKASLVVQKAVDQLVDRIEHGDHVLDRFGEIKRVPVKARDLKGIAADFIDKIRVMRNQPTDYKLDVRADLLAMSKKFKEIARENEEKVVAEQ